MSEVREELEVQSPVEIVFYESLEETFRSRISDLEPRKFWLEVKIFETGKSA